jgi:hypothetical protein
MKPVAPLKVLLIENEGAPGHFQKILGTILERNDYTPDRDRSWPARTCSSGATAAGPASRWTTRRTWRWWTARPE